jgi:hypothetical protein
MRAAVFHGRMRAMPSAPDLSGLREALDVVWKASPLHGKAQLCFESGRYLCAGSGTLITTVLDVKQAGKKTFVVLDTGIHHLGGMSGLGRIPRAAITLQNLTARREGEMVADVVGPLCSPLDSLARGQKMAPVEVGDVLAVPNVGAYGLTASLLGFLSHETPAEVAYRGAEVVETWFLPCWHANLRGRVNLCYGRAHMTATDLAPKLQEILRPHLRFLSAIRRCRWTKTWASWGWTRWHRLTC